MGEVAITLTDRSGSCLSTAAWARRRGGPLDRGGGRLAKPGHHPYRLRRDPGRHLARSRDAIGEDDRDLFDAEAGQHGAVGDLDLKDVSLGTNARQVDGLEDLAANAFEPAGQVMHIDAQNQTRINATSAADQPPEQAPVAHPPTRYIPRAE